MEIGSTADFVTKGDVAQAVAAAMPPFSTAVPKTEMTGGAAGSVREIPPADHQHPRLTSTASGTLAVNGTASVTFTRTFSTKPAVTVMEIDSGGTSPPVDFKVQSWTQDANGNYTGCTIYGTRNRALPTIAPLSSGLLTLLSSLIGALNPILASLSGFAPYEAAGGAAFSLIALQPSPPLPAS